MDALSTDFFCRPTVTVARDLLGCWLVHEHPEAVRGRLTGRIVETEAYTEDDPACHASQLSGKGNGSVDESRRGHDLFAPPGTAYVYLIYGMHWLLNVVTEPEGTAGAVLIRAVEPGEGVDHMNERRGVRCARDLTNGPGKLCEAFDIQGSFHGDMLTSPPLVLAEGDAIDDGRVAQSARIGISEGVDRNWRFYVDDHSYVSRGTPSDET